MSSRYTAGSFEPILRFDAPERNARLARLLVRSGPNRFRTLAFGNT